MLMASADAFLTRWKGYCQFFDAVSLHSFIFSSLRVRPFEHIPYRRQYWLLTFRLAVFVINA